VSGFSREEVLQFDEPRTVMADFRDWLKANISSRAMFISDNNGFDWQFISWYFHHFLGENPFGHSSSNLGSLYKGLARDTFKNFKHLRRTRHTHHPVDDAKGKCRSDAGDDSEVRFEDSVVKLRMYETRISRISTNAGAVVPAS
jgi:hypothetical protein